MDQKLKGGGEEEGEGEEEEKKRVRGERDKQGTSI